MGVINQTVKVKIGSRNFKYYKELGYKFTHSGDEIEIDIEHLQKNSTAKVLVECDFCKKNRALIRYYEYNKIIDRTGSYACKDCFTIKYKQTLKQKFGVENMAQLESVKTKKKETCLERYNAECPMQNDEIQKSIRALMVNKYGVEYPSQSEEIKAKIARASYRNGTVPTSKQQLYLFELYKLIDRNCLLNYPISRFNADICFPEENLEIELDCGGHNFQVKVGQLTQEEFKRKEIIRDSIIKREGYKQMRIISSKDLLPSDEILLQMLQDTRNYFSQYPEHSWIEFNIDTSTVRNAEHKDGIHYNFGELRKINKTA